MDAFEYILALKLRESARFGIHDVARFEPRLRHLSPQLETEIAENRVRLLEQFGNAETRAAMVTRMAAGMFDFLADQYQFLELGDAERAELCAIYEQFVSETHRWLSHDATPPHCPPLSDHHDRLAAWTRQRLADVEALGWAETSDGTVVCGTYSAALQLQLLGLDLSGLMEPVLDLGCGRDAVLVRFLRRTGLAVSGIDRLADPGPGIAQGSWFDAPLEPGAWGTIIAHHSFSLHFLNAHLGATERAVRHARHYMRILSALKPGGQFAYAPGLAFIECHLDPGQFAVSTRAIDGPGGGSGFDADWHATRIIRLT